MDTDLAPRYLEYRGGKPLFAKPMPSASKLRELLSRDAPFMLSIGYDFGVVLATGSRDCITLEVALDYPPEDGRQRPGMAAFLAVVRQKSEDLRKVRTPSPDDRNRVRPAVAVFTTKEATFFLRECDRLQGLPTVNGFGYLRGRRGPAQPAAE